MRKWQRTAVILLAVALVFSLVACSNGNANTDNKTDYTVDKAAWDSAMNFDNVDDVSITVFAKDKTTVYMYGMDIDIGGKAMYIGNAAGYDETSQYIAVIKMDDSKKVVSVTDKKNDSLPLLLATYSFNKDENGKKTWWSMTTESYTATDFTTVLPRLPAEVLIDYTSVLQGKFDDAKYDKGRACYTVKVDNDEYTVKFVDGKLATVIHGEDRVSVGNAGSTFVTLPAVDKANVNA